MPWLVAAREGERVPGMCWGFIARCWEGVQWVARQFCPYELCDLGKVSVLAWRIPETGEPGGLSSMGSHRVGHD